ncbi:MAG TPA: hypothetical protein VMW14_01465 [Candidatus Paceibacterota bacterium]|nr:hypothetical protein [Candidatus Paceibacterota bacterium]
MQPDAEAPPQTKKEHVRRTTIILEEDERKYIDQLIQDGKEAGIKQLVSKMLDVYRSMMIYDWKYPGEYYAGISRVAFIQIEFINTLLQHIPADQHHEVGKSAGEAARIAMETSINLDPTDKEKRAEVFKRLRVQGLGDFYQKDKYIVIKAPYINNPEVQRGYLETLLGATLETRTTTPPYVYELTT